MNRVRLLPEQVANQIAAGEVIERPASVVKELLENALDAQAKQIQVEIQAGGRAVIRVTDDGVGMSRDDALMSLERHATSKIQKAEDLFSIQTMGFRGEAIPSIASVSQFSLTTREQQSTSPEATRIIVHGGKMVDVKTAGHDPGTTVEVRQLFFNLPARRKFLRSEETEKAHIQHYLTLAALAHPGVGFSFIQNQRLVWQLPPHPGPLSQEDRFAILKDRFRILHANDHSLLALQGTETLPPRNKSSEEEETRPGLMKIWGLMGAPGVSRSSRDQQHVFVNQRPVDNRGVHYALMEGYHTALMKGRYPVGCFFIEISADEVDVNIHPAKREVKFFREHLVKQFVSRCVRRTLHEFALPNLSTASPHPASNPSLDLPKPVLPFNQAPPTSPSIPEPQNRPAPSLPSAPHSPPASPGSSGSQSAAVGPFPLRDPASGSQPLSQPITSEVTSSKGATQLSLIPSDVPEPSPSQHPDSFEGSSSTPSRPADPSGPRALLNVPLRFIGIIGKLYIVFESDQGMVLVDQHAAHERVLFEQMLKRLELQDTHSQALLLPETLEFGPKDAVFLKSLLPTLKRLGMGLSEFGETTFLLDALPPYIRSHQPKRFVLELVDALKGSGSDVNRMRLGEQMIAKTVCRHAIKANDALKPEEVEGLMNDLKRCSMPYTCPHGRPTLLEMSYRELEKKFGRTV